MHVVGDGIGVEVFSNKEEKSPLQIAKMSVKYAKENGFNIVIIDTAGRLAVDEEMMKEISTLKRE